MSSEWWRGAVIYQVYPRSFYDGNGDGVGDLPGITQKLDYIASLGVDAVWLSPIFKSPMKDFGYDVSDYCDVDPIFGDLSDFDALVHRAHELGLKVMIDQVLSHSSDEHPWFQQSRASRINDKSDWYVWADALPDGSPPNNWLSVFGGSSWAWDTRRKQYYLHNFLAQQPDLNFHNPEVQNAVLGAVKFWLDRGVDGFRFDTANYFHHDTSLVSNPGVHTNWSVGELPHNPYEMQKHVHDKNRPENLRFFEDLRVLLNQYGAASVGEIGDADALQMMVDYTAGGNRLHMTYSFGFLNPEGHADHVRQQVQAFEDRVQQQKTGSWPCWTVGNHDVVRVLTRWQGESSPEDYMRMVMAMLFSLKGSACWYQGDELSLPEAHLQFEDLVDPPGIAFWPEYKGRDGCRTPMPWQFELPNAGFSGDVSVKPWLPVVESHRTLSVDMREKNQDAALHFMRTFLAWRKTQPALITGDVTYHAGDRNVLSLTRTAEDGASLWAAFNMNAEISEIPLPAGVREIDVPGLPVHQSGVVTGQVLSLPPYGIFFGLLQR